MIAIELHVPDFSIVRTFYGRLGFAELRQEPNYLVLGIEDNIINFYGGSDAIYQHSYFKRFPRSQAGYGVEVVIMLKELEPVYVKACEVGCVEAKLTERAWGASDFRVSDPFGYYLRFTSKYDMLASVSQK